MRFKIEIPIKTLNEIVPTDYWDDEEENSKYEGYLIVKEPIQGIREKGMVLLSYSALGASLIIGSQFIQIPIANISALVIEGVFDGTADPTAE